MEETYQDGSYLTHAGINLIARLIAAQKPLVFTKVTVGDGTLPDGMMPQEMTGLSGYVMDGMIAACSAPGNGQADIRVQVSSIGLEAGFNMTELILWATDPDGGEIAYCYASFQNHPEWIAPDSAAVNKLAFITLITVVSNVPLVTAIINPDALVTYEDLAKYALLGHIHVIAEVVGLREELDAIWAELSLLRDMMSGDMTGGLIVMADFWGLSNVTIIEGWLDVGAQVIRA